MDKNTIMESVVVIVADQFDVPYKNIKLTTNFVNDLGADSLDAVELAMEFEDEFDILIDDSEAEQITDVQSAVDAIYEKINRRSI